MVQDTQCKGPTLPDQQDQVLRDHHKEETKEQCLSEGMGIQSIKLKLNYMATSKKIKRQPPMTGGKAASQPLQVPPQGSPVMKKGGKAMKKGKC